jgi:LexA-binding, inner membrane-associated putative hydrolase
VPSPVAHTLVGLMIGHRSRTRTGLSGLRWFLLVALAANAPDLDFIVGLATDNVNRYHPNPSHSILVGLIFALLATVLLRPILGSTEGTRWRFMGLMALLFASHLALDMFTEQSVRRPALQLFWPLSDAGFLFPWRPLLGILHGGSQKDLGHAFGELFSLHNLGAIALETAVFLPLFWLTLKLDVWLRHGQPR